MPPVWAEAILRRAKLPTATTADREIVTCRMPDGSVRQLFCKYGPLQAPQPPYRLGVAYEARVYDHVLPGWQGDVPQLHGAFLDDTTHTFALVLEYVDAATPLDQSPELGAGLTAAAGWIARFHRSSECAAVPPFLAL